MGQTINFISTCTTPTGVTVAVAMEVSNVSDDDESPAFVNDLDERPLVLLFFFPPSPDEAEEDVIIEQAGDLIASHAEADECIRAFFAFCALAVRRELVVPFEGNAETWRRTRPYTLPSCFALDYGGTGCLA